MDEFDNLGDESKFGKYVPYAIGIAVVMILVGVIGGIIASVNHKEEQAKELKSLDGTNTMTVTVDDTTASAAEQNNSGRTQAYLKYPDGHKEIIWEDEYYSLGEDYFYDKWFATEEGKAWLETDEGKDWVVRHTDFSYAYVTVGNEVIAEGFVESYEIRDNGVIFVKINGQSYSGNGGIVLIEKTASSSSSVTSDSSSEGASE